MPGSITVTITQNNGTATTLSWTAVSNAAFSRIDDYIDYEYANDDDGLPQGNAARKKAWIRLES